MHQYCRLILSVENLIWKFYPIKRFLILLYSFSTVNSNFLGLHLIIETKKLYTHAHASAGYPGILLQNNRWLKINLFLVHTAWDNWCLLPGLTTLITPFLIKAVSLSSAHASIIFKPFRSNFPHFWPHFCLTVEA